MIALTLFLAACGHPPADAKPSKKAAKAPAPAATAPASADDGTVLATWKGGQVTQGELNAEIEGEMRSLEMKYLMDKYEKEAQAVERKVIEAILEAEVKDRGLTDINALMVEEIENKAAAPTDAEIAAFYPQVARQLGGASLEEARPMLIGELTRQNQGKRYQVYIAEVKAKHNVSIVLPYPDLPRVTMPIGDNDPILGNVDAPVTVVQWAEYQCPYCSKGADSVAAIRAKYPDQVRVVYKDFPLSFHQRAVPAATAAHCAGEQDKYWEMGRLLLQDQRNLQDPQIIGYANQLELDMPAWTECYESGKYKDIVMADFEQGTKVGVQATPTFFVNGIMLSGAQPIEKFSVIIDQELEQLN